MKVLRAVVVGLCLTGCSPPPPQVVQDFLKVVACVEANYTPDLPTLLSKCSSYTLEEIQAAIEWLLADPAYQKAHPEAIGPLQARLADVRAERARRE